MAVQSPYGGILSPVVKKILQHFAAVAEQGQPRTFTSQMTDPFAATGAAAPVSLPPMGPVAPGSAGVAPQSAQPVGAPAAHGGPVNGSSPFGAQQGYFTTPGGSRYLQGFGDYNLGNPNYGGWNIQAQPAGNWKFDPQFGWRNDFVGNTGKVSGEN